MQILEVDRRVEANGIFKPRLHKDSIESQSITVSSLLPYTDYKLTMTQIMADSRRWSDSTEILFKTQEAGRFTRNFL